MFLFLLTGKLEFPIALWPRQTKSHCQKQKSPTMNIELNAFLFWEIKKKIPKGQLSILMEKLRNLKFLRDKKTFSIC